AGADAAVVALESLSDAVRTTPEDHDALLAERLGLVLLVVGRIEIRRRRGKLAGAGVHRLVGRVNAEFPTLLANRHLGRVAQRGELVVGESQPLHALELGAAYGRKSAEPALGVYQFLELIQKPGVDAGGLRDFVHRQAGQERALDLENALGRC